MRAFDLTWETPITCGGSEVPVGASIKQGEFGAEMSGSKRLGKIETSVKDDPSDTAFRKVRRTSLDYSGDDYCLADHTAPYRSLASAQEAAWDVGSTNPAPETVLPAITFQYGSTTRLPDTSLSTNLQLGAVSAAGLSWGHIDSINSIETINIDFNGDGRLDRMTMTESGGNCVAEWQKNTSGQSSLDVDFALGGVLTFPRLPWESGSTPSGSESCSMSGQLTMLSNQAPDPQCTTNGPSLLAYRFLDMNGDSLPDLVTAVQAGTSLNPYSADDPLSLPSCSPTSLDEACIDIDETCVATAVDCDNSSQNLCSFPAGWEDDVDDCIEQSTHKSCLGEMIRTAVASGEDTQCGPQNIRLPVKLDCGYHWKVYENLGGSLATTAVDVFSPIALESQHGDSVYSAGYTLSQGSESHSLRDIDGDGLLDAIIVDGGGTEDFSPWQVWKGQGIVNQGFLPRSLRSNGQSFSSAKPYVFFAPALAAPNLSSTFGFAQSIKHSRTQSSVANSNLGALPELLYDNKLYQLLLAPGQQMGRFFGFGSFPDDSGYSQSDPSATYPGYVIDAARDQRIMTLDWDGDGRLDILNRHASASQPTVLPGLADTIGDGNQLHHVPSGSLDGFSRLTIAEVTQLNKTWIQFRDFFDINGDGFGDHVTSDGAPNGTVMSRDFEGKPPRRLHQINNNRGLTIDIQYAPHVDSSIVEGSGRLPRSTWVVKSVARSDAHSIGGTSVHTYADPVFDEDDEGRYGFRGFEQARTVSPLGAVSVQGYDYDVDWSGRLVDSAVFKETAAEAAQAPTRFSTTEWSAFTLFAGAVETIHSTESKSYVCNNGQTRSACEASGVVTVNEVTIGPITSLSAPNGDALAHAPTIVWNRASATGEIGDLKTTIKYALYSDADQHIMRTLDTRTWRSLNASGTTTRQRSRTRNLYSSDGRRIYKIESYTRPGVSSVTSMAQDLDTGNVLSRVKPQQYLVGGSNGAKTSMVYDAFELYPATMTNELGHAVEAFRDNGTGQVLRVRGPNQKNGVQQEALTFVDGFGRVTHNFTTIDDDDGSDYEIKLVEKLSYFDNESPQRVRVENLIDFDDLNWAIWTRPWTVTAEHWQRPPWWVTQVGPTRR